MMMGISVTTKTLVTLAVAIGQFLTKHLFYLTFREAFLQRCV